MKILRPVLFGGILVPSLCLWCACAGTPAPTGDAEPNTGATRPDGPVAGQPAQDPTQQGQEIAQQRREFVIQRSVEEARRALDQKLFTDAANTAAAVLELDPGNEEARRILLTAQELLGQAPAGVTQEWERRVLGEQVEIERTRYQARQDEVLGDALMNEGRYGDAIDAYRRGLMTLQLSVFAGRFVDQRAALEAKLQTAEQARARAENEEAEARRAASVRELEDAERRLAIARATRVRRLLEEANFDFQAGNYERAVQNLDQALAEQPEHDSALALRELSERARHETRLDVLRQEWKAEWSKTFDELQAMDVPQTEAIVFDMKRWAEVDQRQPLQFTAPADLESPEEKAIHEKLSTTRLEHRFAEAPVEEWAAYYGRVTGVNFVATQPVRELDAETTTLKNFSLPPTTSVAQALDVIGRVTGVRWIVRNGVVMLVTPENARGRAYMVPYEVRDIVQGVPNRPGRELKLRAPTDEELPFEEEDTEIPPTIVDETRLTELIKANIDTETWDATATINPNRGVLIVRAPAETHRKIERFLADLRTAVGIQVDIETRFLRVEDSFLEDIGVDFRGLGNQAAEGVPGRGLDGRGNAGFDDFGQRQQINPATPGEIGTGTDPGVFFDDGQDGDLMGRTENLFDRTLGGAGRLDNAGGLSLQYAYLDDTEVEVILRAVQKSDRSEQITAPRLLVYNNSRASMSVLRHTSYIRDFEVEIAQASAIANPVVDVVRDGVVLDVRPVVSADRKFITMELRPTVMRLETPIPTFTTTLGVGQPVTIQLPTTTLQRVRTTVTMPDGGTMMLGGMKLSEKADQVSGVPILQDVPIISFFFSRKGSFVQNMKVLILIKARIVISSEYEPELPELTPTTVTSAR
jgi:Flp pilus assembly secretin CpaC